MDPEIDALRRQVSCDRVLAHAGWKIDPTQSCASSRKYRAGAGHIIIVTHGGLGWFDPLSDARGDVLALAQQLWGGTLGHARKALRPLAGLVPAPLALPLPHPVATPPDMAKLWAWARVPTKGFEQFQKL